MPDPIHEGVYTEKINISKRPEITNESQKVKNAVEAHRSKQGKIIYEVGFGGRFCVNLPRKALSVGIDPMRGMTERDIANVELLEDGDGSNRLVFNEKIDLLPRHVHPDVVVMVAPSPESYEEMMDALEAFVGPQTQFVILIERQSRQGSQLSVIKQIVYKIGRFLKDWGCQAKIELDSEDLEDEFSDLLIEVGIDTGGVLNTHPWQPDGSWATVLGTR
jgi:hypothetical protein